MAKEEEIDIIEMIDEEENVLQFEHLLTFEADEKFYVAFTPIEATDQFDVGDVLIMQIKEDDQGDDIYLPIQSEEELDRLWDIFQELYYEEED